MTDRVDGDGSATPAGARPEGPSGQDAWRARWQAGQTGWDLGGPHPRLSDLVDEARDYQLLPAGARILEPGCGRAHNGAALARDGFVVTSFDAAPEAIAAASALYGDVPRLTLTVRDALTPQPDWLGQFQAIFDRAMLCALPPELRRPYLTTCFEHLAAGGVFLSFPFTEVDLGGRVGPPFAIPMSEMTRLMTSGFSLVTADEYRIEQGDGRIVHEMLCVWRRRTRLLVESD